MQSFRAYRFWSVLLIVVLLASDGPAGSPKIIFDTDMLTDFDDVGALSCLHALADAGECEILATVSCTRGNASVGAIEVINAYYGRPDIPVGCVKGIGICGGGVTPLRERDHDKYRKLIQEYAQWVKHPDSDDAPDANRVYRRILSEQPDGSVTICSVGFLTNLRRLLESGPDEYSSLTGKELVSRKVCRWVAMALRHPIGKEYNSMWDVESSRIVLDGWPTIAYFCDWGLGADVFAGRAVAELPSRAKNPVADIFRANLPSRDDVSMDSERWRRCSFALEGRSAWDEVAVLVAVRGTEPLFSVERGNYRMIGEKGENAWAPDDAGRHRHVRSLVSKQEIGRVIDELMCRGAAVPFGSVQQAVDRIRYEREQGLLKKNELAVIRIPSGVWRIERPIVLGNGDSHIMLTGNGMESSIVSGFRRLPPFCVGVDGIWRCSISGVGRFEQLWVNGCRATRARTPDRGYLYMRYEADEGVDPQTGNLVDLSTRAFYAEKEDIAPLFDLPQGELTNVLLRAYQSWDTLSAKLISVDRQSGFVIAHPSGYRGLFHWKEWRPRYVLENYRSALTAPGEWFCEDDALLYLPRPGEDPRSAYADAPVCEQVLVIDGASDVRIENLGLQGSSFIFPDGIGVRQAANAVGAAVEVTRAKRVALSKVSVSHTAGYGMRLGADVHDSLVEKCLLYDLGAGGLRIGSDRWEPKTASEEVASNIVVQDNVIGQGGRLFPEGVGILLQFAADCQIAHNDICDFYYSGISSGWAWGYRPTPNRNIWIGNNRIRHVGQDVLTDMAGIYTLGHSPDSHVVGNVIQDVVAYRYAGWHGSGLYADEGSEGWRFASNLVVRADTGGIHQNYGRNNRFENNIFAYAEKDMISRSRKESSASFTCCRNIFYAWKTGSAVRGEHSVPAKAEDILFSNNIWSPGGNRELLFFDGTWQSWRDGGQDVGSLVANPLFKDVDNGDFDLQSESPALQVGFSPFDWRKAGVRGGADWRHCADSMQVDQVKRISTPPAYGGRFRFETGFEAEPAGRYSPYGGMFPLGGAPFDRDGLERVDGSAREGCWSLEFADNPDFSKPWMPAAEIDMEACTNAFRIISFSFEKTDGSSSLVCELRDLSQDLKNVAGPSLRLGSFGMVANKETVVPVLQGGWHDVELRVGRESWGLRIVKGGQCLTEKTGLPLGAGFGTVRKIVFYSPGSRTGRFRIDNISIFDSEM